MELVIGNRITAFNCYGEKVTGIIEQIYTNTIIVGTSTMKYVCLKKTLK
ncbi:hypothetical protein [Enterococcus sp. AZ128]